MPTLQAVQPALSIIIPAWNEALRLGPTFEAIKRYAQKRSEARIEVIIVDDASTDNSVAVIEALDPEPIVLRYLRNETNRGKGYSVRRGMLEAHGCAILMTDADLSTPIEESDKLLAHLEQGAAVVIGSRSMPDSVIDPPQGLMRWLTHNAFRIIRGAIMLPDIRDTQCGFKAFTAVAARGIFRRQRTDGFAFDCEVLGLARAMGYPIREVAVIWRNDARSTLRLWKDGPAMLWSLLKIRRMLKSCPPQTDV